MMNEVEFIFRVLCLAIALSLWILVAIDMVLEWRERAKNRVTAKCNVCKRGDRNA